MNRRELFKFLFGLGLGVAAAETYERLYNIPALERAFRKEIEYWLSQYLNAKRKTEELSSKLKRSEEEIDTLQKDVSYWKSQYDVAQDEVNKLNTKVDELSSKLKRSEEEIDTLQKDVSYWKSQYDVAQDEVNKLNTKVDELSSKLNEADEKIDSLEKELDNWKSKYESTKEKADRLKSIIGSMDELERESVDAISYYREKMNEAINNLKRTIEKYRAILGDDRVAFESSTVKILEDLKLTQEKADRLKSIIGSMDELERESVDAISYYREKMNEAINNLKRTIEKYRAILGDDRVAFESSTVKILEDLKLTQEKLKKVLPYFPLILNFAWKPTKVINDKIYDIKVSFEVISPLNSLKEVEVMLIPEEYRYFITKYGMREEDYHKVFPKEEVRSVKIKPRNLEREMFSVDFEDLKGGREYIVKARVEDVAGSEKVVEVKTPYIRQFENLGKELYEKGVLVGASYMIEYHLGPWNGINPDDLPLLGRYDPSDEIVQWKHIDWAGYAGIYVFFIDAGAWEEWKINGKQGNIMKGLMDKGMRCAFMWYAWGDYFDRGTDPNAPEWAIDLRHPKNKSNFVNQLSTILNSELIKHHNYFRIGVRPVVFIYDAAAFIHETEAFEELRDKTDKNASFLADTILRMYALPENSDWYFKLKDFSNYDWISGWAGFINAHVARTYSPEEYDEKYYIMTDKWSKWVKNIYKSYVSSVIPGFKYAGESKGIPRDINRIKNQLLYSLDITKLIRIDTWNDFGENTFIEPSQKDTFNYLYKVHEVLKSKFSKNK